MAISLDPRKAMQRSTIEKRNGEEFEWSGKMNESVYLVDCNNCVVTVASKCTKVSIENCKDTKVILKFGNITSFLEVINCTNSEVTLGEGVFISTIMVDGSTGVTIRVSNPVKQLEKIWWHKVSKLNVDRGAELGLFLLDKIPENNEITKFQHVCKVKPDNTFSKEPVMRENGYPVTEEEKLAAEEKMKEYDQHMLEMIKQNISITPKKT
eukprot:sb/3470251/